MYDGNSLPRVGTQIGVRSPTPNWTIFECQEHRHSGPKDKTGKWPFYILGSLDPLEIKTPDLRSLIVVAWLMLPSSGVGLFWTGSARQAVKD